MEKYNLHYVLFTLACTVLIINTAYIHRPVYSKVLSNKVLITLGKISYGFYLYTPFIAHKVDAAFFGGNPFQSKKTMIITDLITGVISFTFSYLSYIIIEKNILRLKGRFEPKAKNLSVIEEVSAIPAA